jgi:lysophospholipase
MRLISTITSLSLISAIPLVNAQIANQSYTPVVQPCANGTTLVCLTGTGSGQILSQQKQSYISFRHNNTLPSAWQSYLSNIQAIALAQNVTVPSYISSLLNASSSDPSSFPILGIALSGGGYRATTFSGGVLNALDSQNPDAMNADTGGLLQAASYITGSFGASWLIGSLARATSRRYPPLPSAPTRIRSYRYRSTLQCPMVPTM